MAVPERTTRLLSGTAAYAAAAVVQRAVGFLLLPVYARVLTPAEYGQIGVLMTIAAAVATVLSFGLETAVFRTCVRLHAHPAELRSFVNTVGAFAIAAPLLVAIIASLVLAPLLARVYDAPETAVGLGFVGASLLTSATVVPLAVLRAQERLGDYLRLTGVQVILSIGLTVTFVVIVQGGVVGWMLAFAAAAGALLVRGLVVLAHPWSRQLDGRHLATALAFGLPMIPHALAHWGLSLSDRLILGAFLDSAAVGVYYVAYLFGLPISLLAVALSQAVQPIYARASLVGGKSREISRSASDQLVACAVATMAVATLGPPAIQAFLPVDYAPAATYVPWIALGYGLYAMYFVPMNAVTVLSGETRWVWVVTVFAALVNIGLNLVLVPLVGAIAAAINTVIGYAILVAGISIYMFRVAESQIRIDTRRIGASFAIVLGGSVIGLNVSPESPMLQLILRGGLVTVVIGLIVLFRIRAMPAVSRPSAIGADRDD